MDRGVFCRDSMEAESHELRGTNIKVRAVQQHPLTHLHPARSPMSWGSNGSCRCRESPGAVQGFHAKCFLRSSSKGGGGGSYFILLTNNSIRFLVEFLSSLQRGWNYTRWKTRILCCLAVASITSPLFPPFRFGPFSPSRLLHEEGFVPHLLPFSRSDSQIIKLQPSDARKKIKIYSNLKIKIKELINLWCHFFSQPSLRHKSGRARGCQIRIPANTNRADSRPQLSLPGC